MERKKKGKTKITEHHDKYRQKEWREKLKYGIKIHYVQENVSPILD